METDIQSITKPLLNRYVDFFKELFGDNLLSIAVFGFPLRFQNLQKYQKI